MRVSGWQKKLGISLIVLSALLYLAQYFIFGTPRNIAYYFFQDLAFLPIEVLLVTVILHSLLTQRERRERLRKMNMVIGSFFTEAGSGLIGQCLPFLSGSGEAGELLRIDPEWTESRFDAAAAGVKARKWEINARRGDLAALKSFLVEKRMFLLRMLENPNLLEHETFTDLLWAVFHLSDELDHRTELRGLPESDLDHLSGDIHRAFTLLVMEWLAYTRHLKHNYPYLFSLTARTNPFDSAARAIVGE